MDIKNFVLSYYNNAVENFHIQKVWNTYEAKNHIHTNIFKFTILQTVVSIFLRNLRTDKNILPKVSIKSEDIFYIESMMERMRNAFNCKNFGFIEIFHSYAVLLVAVLARNYFEKNTLPEYFKTSKQFVLHCIEYIDNNFTKRITDFSTFYRNFKKIMGVSPKEFKKNNL